jgi:hypothetical protein
MTDIQVRTTSFYFLVPVVSKADNQMVKFLCTVTKKGIPIFKHLIVEAVLNILFSYPILIIIEI